MVTASFTNGRDGTRLYLRRRGGPGDVTLLLCDGIACDGFIWRYLWDDLAPFGPVAHWNYRGHGRSAKPADPAAITVEEHAHDLDAVRRAIGDGPVVLLGHSFGCQVALENYRIHRDNLRGLVLICGAPGRVTHTFRNTNIMAQVLPKVIARVEAYPEIARAIWSRVPPEIAVKTALLSGEVDAQSIDPEALLPYMRHMVDIDLLMFLRMLNYAGEHSAMELLSEIQVPTLVIAGDRDNFTPPECAQQMAAAIPGAELMIVQGGTHVVPIERREMVLERVAQFLRPLVQ